MTEPAPKRASPITALVALGAVLALLAFMVPSLRDSEKGDGPSDWCVEIVAEWAGADAERVTPENVSDENTISGRALDFRGTYPGGEWACGGRARG